MADSLERLVQSIEGEGPSPEFVADLRTRVLAETATSGIGTGDEPVDLIDLRPETEGHAMTTKRWILAGVAAVIAVIVGVAVLSGGDDDGGGELDTVDQPTDSTPDAEGTSEFGADATPLPTEFGPLRSDTYLVDAMETPFLMTVDTAVWVQENRTGFLAMSFPTSDAPGDRDLVFTRLATLWDPTQPDVAISSQGDGWPTDDIDGWLDALPAEIVIADREATTLGGPDVIRVDFELGECTAASSCHNLGRGGSGTFSFAAGSTLRIWFVDQGDEDPLVAVAAILDAEDAVWLESAAGIVDTAVFGEVQPSP
jgi:hypothetical protein